MANLSPTTFQDFEAQVRRQTGADNYTDPPSSLIMRWTNVLMHKVHLLSRKKDTPWGRNTVTLTNLNTTGKYHAPGDGGSYTASTKTFAGLTVLDQTYVGGWAFFRDAANSRIFYGLIDSVSGTTSCTLRFQIGTGAAANIASASLMALLKPAPAFYGGANLSASSVLDIVKLVDSSLGNMVRLDPDVFADVATHPSYKNVACVQYAGDSVYVNKGASAGTYGTWTLTFNEKPATITALTSTIDLRPEFIPALVDAVSAWVVQYMANKQKAA